MRTSSDLKTGKAGCVGWEMKERGNAVNTLSKNMGLDVSLSSKQASPPAVTTDFTQKRDELFEAEAHVSLNVISGCYPQIDSPSGHHELENVTPSGPACMPKLDHAPSLPETMEDNNLLPLAGASFTDSSTSTEGMKVRSCKEYAAELKKVFFNLLVR
jgi:hypothetical protein